MSYFIFLSLCAVAGAAAGSLDLSPKDWQFWAISGCIVGSYISGGI